MESNNIVIAFTLTLIAGLSTGIGSLISFLQKGANKKFLSVALGFSAGVMLYVAFMDIIKKSIESLSTIYGARLGAIYGVLSFFAGILLIGLIDKFVPEKDNPHEISGADGFIPVNGADENNATIANEKSLYKMGIFTALAIGIHNFPEGIATFMAALENPKLGITITIAIAIHNIPEGLSVSAPIYYATRNRKKAFFYSFLSGFSEPIGAIVGYFLLRSFFSPSVFGIVFGCVAGIMVYISLDELLPTAREFDSGHNEIYGVIIGMAVMALSIIMFG